MPSQLDVDKIRHTNGTDALTFDASGNTNLQKDLKFSSTAAIKNSAGNNILSESGGTVTLTADEANVGSNALVVDSSGNVGVGTSPDALLDVENSATPKIRVGDGIRHVEIRGGSTTQNPAIGTYYGGDMTFVTDSTERMRIDSSGNVAIRKSVSDDTVEGTYIAARINQTTDNGPTMLLNRHSSDGDLIILRQANVTEGSIHVSGTTVSLIGGHLSRWSQLPDSSKDETIVKGTVMTNLDAMCEWSYPDEYWTEEDEIPVDEENNPTAVVGDLKKAAYTEDNEQLNRMVVSSVEGDPNVAGVFVNWDNDDEQFNDMNIAMTGDMVIRIAQGTTVQRGDLLMSAGDGTAKPQGDDIVRSKTIAKVTSTHVSHTYGDGSYLVPCVLMAC